MILFTDLHFNLEKTITNDFASVSDIEAINQSIINILLTKTYDYVKYDEPFFGSKLHEILSEKANRFTEFLIKERIQLALQNYETRIRIDDIIVGFDKLKEVFKVNIYYTIISLNEKSNIEVSFDIIK